MELHALQQTLDKTPHAQFPLKTSDEGLNAEDLILQKDAYNATRPYMRGRKF